jgi:FK506-binding protein 4/5
VPPNSTLLIDLELISWKIVTEIGDDKKILKKVLKEGEGYERPNEGAVVKGMLWCSCFVYCFQLMALLNLLRSVFTLHIRNFILLLTVKITGKLRDGTIFSKKGHDEEPFEFKTDEGWLFFFISAPLAVGTLRLKP